MTFASGLPDCCTTDPETYKVLAELPNARLVEMTAAPGTEDQPHEHPSHSMYFGECVSSVGRRDLVSTDHLYACMRCATVTSCKLEIKDGPPDAQGEPHVAEVPAGAAPIFPAGAHQVKNIGEADAKVIFVESYPTCKPCGVAEGFNAPFKTTPECYKLLAENDDWITGELTMDVGQADSLHDHLDHLIYVLEGDEVTIYPNGVLGDAHAVPIKPGAGLAAPMSAGPIFAKHSMKNTGTVPLKMIFFEMKK